MDSLPSFGLPPDDVVYVGPLSWPWDLLASAAPTRTWPLTASAVDLDALMWSMLNEADRRRRDAFTRLLDCSRMYGVVSRESWQACESWLAAYDQWSALVALILEHVTQQLARLGPDVGTYPRGQ